MSLQGRNDSQIQRVAGTTPNFLANYADEDKSLDALGQFVTVPRLKIIAGQSDPELKKRFGEGSVIVRPGDALVWKDGDEPFLFVPEFFYTEWCLWADRRDKDQPNPIVRRSFDPTSDIAKAASDKATREVIYECDENKPPKEQRVWRYVQHFCFPGKLYSGDYHGTPVVMSFERGEIGTGYKFITAVKMRRQEVEVGEGEAKRTERVKVPLWAQVWGVKVGPRQNDSGNWFGFDLVPAGVIDSDDAEEFHGDHLELMQAHEQRRLVTDYGGNEVADQADQQQANQAQTAEQAAGGRF